MLEEVESSQELLLYRKADTSDPMLEPIFHATQIFIRHNANIAEAKLTCIIDGKHLVDAIETFAADVHGCIVSGLSHSTAKNEGED
jgi:hypothetical protein